MSGKFKLTLDGQTKVIQDSPANFEKIAKLKDQGVKYELTPIEEGEEDSAPQAPEAPAPETAVAPTVRPGPANTQPSPERDDSVWTGMKAGLSNTYGGLADAAQDIARGVRKGATLGWDDELARLGGKLGSRLAGGRDSANTYAGMTPSDSMKQDVDLGNAESLERSPVLNRVGQFVGGAGTTAALMAPVTGLGAGAGILGRTLSAPQLGSKVAQLATRLAGQNVIPATSGAASQGVQRMAQALAQQQAINAGKYVAGAAGAGTAGLVSAAQSAGEAQPGETADDATVGLITGTGTQGALSGLGAGASAASPALKNVATRIRNSVAAPNKTMMKALQAKFGVDKADQVMGQFIEKYVPQSSKSRSADDYLRELSGKLSQDRLGIADLDKQAGRVEGLNEFVPGEWDQVVQDTVKDAEQAGKTATSRGQRNVASALKQDADTISWRPPDEPTKVMTNPDTAPKDLADLRDKVGAYGDDAFGPMFSREDGATNESALKMWQRSKDAQNKLFDEYALPETAQKYHQTNKDFSEKMALNEALKNVSAGEGSGHLGTELVSGVVSGAIGGAGTALAAGGNPLAGAAVGAQANVGTGTNSVSKRFWNNSQAKDLYANATRGMGHYADKLGQSLGKPSPMIDTGSRMATGTSDNGQSTAVTNVDKVQHALRYNPQQLGDFAQRLQQFEDDPDQLAKEVERLEQDDKLGQQFRTLPVFGGK